MNRLYEFGTSSLERLWPTPQQQTALRRLWAHAQGNTGQCRITSAFLLGLYNGRRFPFDLTKFRALDESLFRDCLDVLEMDSTPMREVHDVLGVPGRQFEALAQYWGLVDVERLEAGEDGDSPR
jgi:hypothetical protein